MLSCVFCKIINKEIPATVIKENDHAIAIKDLHPKAPIHYLVIPKKHIENLLYLEDQDGFYGQAMLQLIKDIAQDFEDPKAFNVFANNGKEAGQSVLHLHFHLLSGKDLYEGGLTL